MNNHTSTKTSDGKHYLEAELEDLAKTDQFWAFLRTGTLNGVWYWDLENPEHEWMSPELWALFGIDPATKAHDPTEWQDLIHPDDLDLAFENFSEHCANPNHPYDQIVRYRHENGSTVWVRCRGLAIRDAEGNPVRMLGTHTDVTPLKVAEEAFRHEHELANTANDELRTFAYSISHDLKSPANTARMLLAEVRHALGEGDDEDACQLLEKAETTLEAMNAMIEDLLAYTRVIGADIQLTTLDLDDVLAQVTESLASDIAAAKARVEIGPCGQIKGCEWQVKLLFQNLISNAVKFRDKWVLPKIRISATDDEYGRRRITVADNGIGIAEADQHKIFDLFAKLHRPSDFSGSGIGLALCQRVALAHGSGIEVCTPPGGGTSFTVSLPT